MDLQTWIEHGPPDFSKNSKIAEIGTPETLTDGERQAIAYMEKISAMREAGRVPPSYTAQTVCRGCGPVWIFEGSPARVDLCPWCRPRIRGVKIPRPLVRCITCQHFTPSDTGGIGTCPLWKQTPGAAALYPRVQRQCAHFIPKETTK